MSWRMKSNKKWGRGLPKEKIAGTRWFYGSGYMAPKNGGEGNHTAGKTVRGRYLIVHSAWKKRWLEVRIYTSSWVVTSDMSNSET